jgi:hypothetical protein
MRRFSMLLPVVMLAACSLERPAPQTSRGTLDLATMGAATNPGTIWRWDGGNQLPESLAYVPSANYDANNCELWVNGFGKGNFANGGFTNDWLEAYISVPAEYGQLLNAAIYVRSHAQDSSAEEQDIVLGNLIARNYYATGFNYGRFGIDVQTVDLTVDEFAFFVDVKRPTGEIVRLWQSDAGNNYAWSETFALPPSGTKSLGGGDVVYANNGAHVFDQRGACN